MRHSDGSKKMDGPQSITEIMKFVMADLFEKTRAQRTPAERRSDSEEAMEREIVKICEMLDLDPATLKPRSKAA